MLNEKSFYYVLDILSLFSKHSFSVKTSWDLHKIIKSMYKFGVKV